MWDEDELQVEKDFTQEKSPTTLTGYFSSFFSTSTTDSNEKKPEEIVVEKKEKKDNYNSPTTKTNKKMFSNQKSKPTPGSLSREKNENATMKVHGAKYSLPIYNSDSPGPVVETPTPQSNIKVDESKLQMKINEINVQTTKTNEMSDRVGTMNKRKVSSSLPPKNKNDNRVGVMNSNTNNNQSKIIIDQNTKNNISTKLNVLDLPPVVKVDVNTEISPTTKLNTKTSIGNSIGSSKLKKFSILLVQDNINLDELKKISFSGVPPELRSQIWKYLIGYLPGNKLRRDATLERKRKEYLDFVDKYYDDNLYKKSEEELATLKQISKDVPRTSPDIKLFQQKRIQNCLERILYIWSIRHPASGYVQGINDLVTPFLTVFLIDYIDTDDVLNYDVKDLDDEKFKEMEADTFWCFSLFVDFNQDMYTFAQPGVQRMVQKLEEIIEKIDYELYDHIVKKQKCDFIQFSFRWMNCLLMREIPLIFIIRMFDTYLSEGDSFANLHSFVCASFLKTFSSKLKTLEFGEMIMFIQNLPTSDWTANEIETLLSQAYMLQCLYK